MSNGFFSQHKKNGNLPGGAASDKKRFAPEELARSAILRKTNTVTSKNALVEEKTRKKIVLQVAVGHLAIIILPFVIVGIFDYFKPEEKKIKVMLISQYDQIRVEAPSPPVVAPPVEIPPIAPPPAPTPPTVEMPKVTVKPPPVTPPSVKPPQVRPPSVAPPQVSPPRVAPPQVSRPQAPVQPTFRPIKPGDIPNLTPPTRPSAPGNTAPSIGDPGPSEDNYESQLYSFLYARWIPPGENTLKTRNPSVLVSLSIASNGRVVEAKIVTPSNIAALDDSVRTVLVGLHQVPRPPSRPNPYVVLVEFRPIVE